MSQGGRLPGLDALRGMAALGVLFWHYGGHFGATPLAGLFHPFYTAGLYLVDVFFVLSGFLLGHLYVDAGVWKSFLFKRVTRLFPLHWTTLLVVAGLQLAHQALVGHSFVYANNDGFHFLLNLGLLQHSGLQAGFSFNGPGWSISVEWLVNLLFLALLALPRAHHAAAFGLAGAALIALVLGQGHLIGQGLLWGSIDAGLLRGVFGFFIGVGVARLFPSRAPVPSTGGWFRPWDGVGVVATLVLLGFMGSPTAQATPLVDFAVIGLAIPLLVIACSRGPALAAACRWRPLVWLGDVSFSVYLWHFPLQILFALAHAAGWIPSYDSVAVLAGFLALSYLLGHLSWRHFERPVQDLARHSALGRACRAS